MRQFRVLSTIGIAFCGTVLLIGFLIGGLVMLARTKLPEPTPLPPLVFHPENTQWLLPQRADSLAQQLLYGLGGVFSRKPKTPEPHLLAAVMVENHYYARPHQTGLEDALFVQEWLVEGGISRFIALYDILKLPHHIGPVRSIRPYFFHSLRPWTQVFVHAGDSPEAREELTTDADVVDINGLFGKYAEGFVRDANVPEPHNFFLRTDALPNFLSGALLQTSPWPPYLTVGDLSGSGANVVKVSFLSPSHDTVYTYDAATETYARTAGGIESKTRPSTLLFAQLPITDIGEIGRLTIPLAPEGKLLVMRQGKMQTGRFRFDEELGWAFLNDAGEPLPLGTGQVWMTVLPQLDRVTYE